MATAQDNKELPADSQYLPAHDIFNKSQWLKFNVGGATLETTRGSLERLRSEFFALLLDPDSDDIPSLDGVYRLDRDADALRVLLNYGRYGRVVSVPDHITEAFLLAEIQFYRMHADVARAVGEFFEEKRLGPGSVRIEHVTITEMAMDKGRLHHNVYDVLRTSDICCYTKVPGSGTCYHKVSHLFAYEMPHSKFPALFRATCQQCRRRVCVADDPIIGLEGWCHKCRLCLRCQDILCDAVPDELTAAANRPEKERENQTAQNEARSLEVRKTASVVFVCDSRPPTRAPSPMVKRVDDFISNDMDEHTGAAIARATGLTLPKFSKLPPVAVARGDGAATARRHSTTFTGSADLPKGFKDFKDFLKAEKWSL